MKMIRVLFALIIILIISTIILAIYAAVNSNDIKYTQENNGYGSLDKEYDLVNPDNQYTGQDFFRTIQIRRNE